MELPKPPQGNKVICNAVRHHVLHIVICVCICMHPNVIIKYVVYSEENN